jgi:cell wall-associated NlpC family hydrolase
MFTGHFRRLLIAMIAIALALTLVAIQSPVAAQAKNGTEGSQAQRLIRIARTHIGARFQMGAEGMRRFDCSGLVYRVYQQAGLIRKIGGKRMLAAQYYHWFKSRGLASKSNPKPGDLVWWTKHGRIKHMGLYIGGGRALSALINPWGVKTHSLRGIRVKFLAFGHVRLDS